MSRPFYTHECPQKYSAHSVQPFGRLLKPRNIYMNVLFYYIDIGITYTSSINIEIIQYSYTNIEITDIFLYKYRDYIKIYKCLFV